MALAAQTPAGLSGIRTVYLFPMSRGFDQYLANRLAAAGVVQVTSDPAKAEAVFTDRLGEAFERRLAALLPQSKPAPDAKAAGAKEAKADTGEEKEKRDTAQPRYSSFGGGRGTLFLVDARSRTVVWSTFEKPRSFAPAELDKTAARIVEKMTNRR